MGRTPPEVLTSRRAGILLHPTALPSPYGPLGASARHWIDFMVEAGLSVWQMLPLGPTQVDDSPYQSPSAHAGSPNLIDMAGIVELGLLTQEDLPQAVSAEGRAELFQRAATRFFETLDHGDPALRDAYLAFVTQHQHAWLEDYALFEAIHEKVAGDTWPEWPAELRDRDPQAMAEFRAAYPDVLNRVRFEQFIFDQQWTTLRQYAHSRGIFLFGDIPIFVALDSADVWANPGQFKLAPDGSPIAVAGVPPDYFAPTGQHWGNPLYDWDKMAADGFEWWLNRLASQRERFDIIRLDHFRGLHAYWEIPAGEQDAVNGRWVEAPGYEFLTACFKAFPDLPLIAENLGIIGEEVEALRHAFELPGMVVLQFAFDKNPDNPHIPYNHSKKDVVYTGTHDNTTGLSWYEELDPESQDYLADYNGYAPDDKAWLLIRMALASVSCLAVVPLQDFLGLGYDARFNTPGTTEGNWQWQFRWEQFPADLASTIRHMVALYGRL
ncbi:MAG: 4-alpha-glucanotransferase [Oleiphilaceae bacterium]|nr:4-alpha-glucanotransferase [Oleiphilaceae bacterium]